MIGISSRHLRGVIAGLAMVALAPLAAMAHHGWSWTQDGFFQLKGVIAEVYIGNPHATIDVDVDGSIWRVELAPPSRTIAAGFTQEVARVGDEVTAIGNRSQDDGENRMKAVRLIINGQAYDVYPYRAPS